jgi:hypothetical protein
MALSFEDGFKNEGLLPDGRGVKAHSTSAKWRVQGKLDAAWYSEVAPQSIRFEEANANRCSAKPERHSWNPIGPILGLGLLVC